MSSTSEELLAKVQQKLEETLSSPVVVLHQTRDFLADRCGTMKIVLSSGAPRDPSAWLQEFQMVNSLRVLAEQYLEAFLAVRGKTP